MKKKQIYSNKLIIILLVFTNFLLFALLLLVSYIAVQSRKVFQKDLNSINQSIEKNLGSLSHLAAVKENLTDLSQVGKKLNAEEIKDKITELTASINKLGNFDDIKQKLAEVGSNLSQSIEQKLIPLNNLANNLQTIKNELQNLDEIKDRLEGLSNLQGIKENLNNLENIKNDLSKFKMPGSPKELEAIKEKLAGLEKEGEALVNKFSESVDSVICSECHQPKPIEFSTKMGKIQMSSQIVKKEIWEKWVKSGKFKLKYCERVPWSLYNPLHGGGWSDEKELDKENSAELDRIKKDKKNFKVVFKGYKCLDCNSEKELEGLDKYKISTIIDELLK